MESTSSKHGTAKRERMLKARAEFDDSYGSKVAQSRYALATIPTGAANKASPI